MSQIDKIVSVNISRQTQQIDIASFDIPLLLVRVDEAEISMPNRVETFTSIDGVGSFFGVEHVAYKIATKLLSGDLRPAEFKIGKVAYDSSLGSGTDTGVVASGITDPTSFDVIVQPVYGVVEIDEDGAYVYTGEEGYSGEDTFTVEVSDGTSSEEVEVEVEVVASPKIPESYSEALQEVMTADPEWYALLSEAKFDQDILSLAAIIQAQRRMYFTSSSEVNILDPQSTTDVAALLSEAGYSRTSIMYSPYASDDYPEAAWVGTQIVEVPGSNTWAFKRLEGTRISRLTDTQISAIEDKDANYYINVKGAPITQTGRTSSGEFIDIMIGVDWLHARIQEAVFYRLINRKKIPMTRAGAALIESEIRSVLGIGVANGLIADDTPYTVITPDPLMLPETERALRRLGDFRFDARLAGAVHSTVIRGVVTV